jgi:hypothetical protein
VGRESDSTLSGLSEMKVSPRSSGSAGNGALFQLIFEQGTQRSSWRRKPTVRVPEMVPGPGPVGCHAYIKEFPFVYIAGILGRTSYAWTNSPYTPGVAGCRSRAERWEFSSCSTKRSMLSGVVIRPCLYRE